VNYLCDREDVKGIPHWFCVHCKDTDGYVPMKIPSDNSTKAPIEHFKRVHKIVWKLLPANTKGGVQSGSMDSFVSYAKVAPSEVRLSLDRVFGC
jgi:hypothetical protein